MQKKRVLVVEDDTIVARDIGLSLKTLGYEVAAVAYAAEEAVREAARLKPDVVLMDITLRGGGTASRPPGASLPSRTSPWSTSPPSPTPRPSAGPGRPLRWATS
ncbi:MAG: response regulator [Nitrospirota bacterium]